MRVLGACSLGGAGHLHPLVPVLDAARRRGDDVLVVGPPALEDLVAATGHAFRAGGEPPEADVAPIRERLPLVPPGEATRVANRELFGHLATAAMLPAMTEICATWRPDLVVREPSEYASAIVACRSGLPAAQVAISLAEAEAGSITAAAPALEPIQHGVVEALRTAPYLTRLPATLDPSPFPTTIRFHEPRAPATAPLPDWWGGSDAPLVYLTLGTVVGYLSSATALYRTVLQAVAGLDVRVLLTIGRRVDPAALGPVPASVHVEAWIDQALVLGDADLVVCHGGSGTVFAALAAGVPVVVVPLFADQFENGRRIAAAGAGVVADHPPLRGGTRRVVGSPDAPGIAEHIGTVLADPSYRRAAARVADDMAATPTADEVLVALGHADDGRGVRGG